MLLNSADPQLEALVRWSEERGARMPALALRRREDGQRGVYARAHVPAGALVLELPRRLFLSQELAVGSDLGRRIAASGVELADEQSWLAAFLLQEKHAACSTWARYVATLPASYRHMPFFLEPGELSLLAGSYARRVLEAQRRSIAQDYASLCRHVPGFERFGSLEFAWARLSVVTRAFRLTTNAETTRALLPVADMFDHKRPRETSWTYDDAREAFTLTALQDFRPGDPVRVSYGRKCNGYLFVNYGFCLEENEDNVAELPVPAVRPDHRFYREAQALWAEDGGFRIPARHAAEATRRLFSFLRLACARDGERPAKVRDGLIPGEVAPVTARNEEAVLRALAAACEEALGRFETTLEQDEALLREPGLPAKARHCILLRRGEKQVLHAWRSLANTAIPLLHGSPRALLPAAGAPAGAAPFAGYLASPPPHRSPQPLSPTSSGGLAGAPRLADGLDYLQDVVWELAHGRERSAPGRGLR